MRVISKYLIALVMVTTSWVATELPSVDAAGPDNDRVYPAVYQISDLPVWTTDHKFDPSILMRLIRLTTEESDWESNGGKSGYTCYPDNLCLVISTNRQNHKQIKELMATLRKDKATE